MLENNKDTELWAAGYGKDAAGIELEAINHVGDIGNDVVLVDIAGKMQDNKPLMSVLSKLISVNKNPYFEDSLRIILSGECP